MVLLLLQKNDNDEPAPDDLHRVGTVAIIRQMAKAPGRHARARRRRRARARRVPAERARLLCGADQAAAGSRRSDRSRSTRTCGGCRSSSTARCRSPPASRPTSSTLVASLDDPLRIAYLLASLLDMKPEDKQRLLEENSVVDQARRRRDGAGARDRRARAEGTDRVARRKGNDRRAAAVRAAPADEGDPDRARRRATAKSRSCASGSPTRSLPEHVAAVANARSRSARADDAGGARVPDDPHLPRLAARRALGEARPRIGSTRSKRAACSTRITTTSTRSRSASSSTSRSGS